MAKCNKSTPLLFKGLTDISMHTTHTEVPLTAAKHME